MTPRSGGDLLDSVDEADGRMRLRKSQYASVGQVATVLMNSASVESFKRDGYLILSEVVARDHGDRIMMSLATLSAIDERRRGGVRNLFAELPSIRGLAREEPIRAIVDALLSPTAFAVRAIMFDKTPESNWSVPWHQDTTIAVTHRCDDLVGYGPWSVKSGVTHVQPPASVLERMITVRLHLDDCGVDAGALEVVPQSHREGVTNQIPSSAAVSCPVAACGAVVMHPLLWHASSKAALPTHRRVLHIEYADIELPDPLDWHERW